MCENRLICYYTTKSEIYRNVSDRCFKGTLTISDPINEKCEAVTSRQSAFSLHNTALHLKHPHLVCSRFFHHPFSRVREYLVCTVFFLLSLFSFLSNKNWNYINKCLLAVILFKDFPLSGKSLSQCK